ncbi:MAG: amidohydrolase family protein [Verrucomicrobiae bacterium]|nr:amidohydrolase family protein [Verrucomicrobiae bacterium]
MPGLINAHCHLDYTAMAGRLPAPRYFPDWLKGMLAYKAHWGFSEYAQSWLAGARMLLENGTTTVVDIEAVPELLADVWQVTPLRVFSLLELTNVRHRREPAVLLQEALKWIAPLPRRRCRPGLSPHALYSTTPALVQAAAALCRRRRWLMAMHVAESVDEFEMFTRRAGRMYDWLAPQRDMTDCGGHTPVERLAELGVLAPNFLAVHVNYATPHDAEVLARHKVGVVHCPSSHRYFKHRPFPLALLLKAGVNVCLGTDSLASTLKQSGQPLELNLFSEMRQLAAKNPELPPEAILKMATLHGARAIGLQNRLGELKPGAYADLVALPAPARLPCPFEYVVQAAPKPLGVMIDGKWLMEPHGYH